MSSWWGFHCPAGSRRTTLALSSNQSAGRVGRTRAVVRKNCGFSSGSLQAGDRCCIRCGARGLNAVIGSGAHRARGKARRTASCRSQAANADGVSTTEGTSQDGVDGEQHGVPLIEVRNICKAFGKKRVFSGASFKLHRGEALGIIGPSGTGKSTILRLISGLIAPDSGEILINGKPRKGLASDDEDPDVRIGMVFQSAALFDSLNVRENVGFLLYEHSNLSHEQISQRVTESLAEVGLYGVEERMPSELSGGMKKRVALARAIISDAPIPKTQRGNLGKLFSLKDIVEPEDSSSPQVPTKKEKDEVIMYDEPTAGLDPIASTLVEDLMRKLHEPDRRRGGRSAYIVVTHQYSTIMRAVDKLVFLNKGKVAWQGTTDEFEVTEHPAVKQFASGSLNGPIKY